MKKHEALEENIHCHPGEKIRTSPDFATLALWFRVVSYLNSTWGQRKGALTFPGCGALPSSPWYEGPRCAALGRMGSWSPTTPAGGIRTKDTASGSSERPLAT